MPYRNAFEMQKPWAVEVVRCINEGGNGGWDANEMTRKNPCTTEWMNQHCINESVSQWINESVNQRMNESMNQWIDDSVNRWINESMVQWSNEPMHQCMNDLVGGWISPRASKIYINLQCYSVRIKFCDFGASAGDIWHAIASVDWDHPRVDELWERTRRFHGGVRQTPGGP